MKTVYKIVFFSSLTFIVLCILTALLLGTTPLAFKNPKVEDSFTSAKDLGLPLAIIMSLTGPGFKKSPNSSYATSRIIVTILTSGIIFIVTIFYAFGKGMCAWSTRKEIFQSKTDPALKIVERDFGCGATDSGPPIVQTFKIKEVAHFFIYATKTDINQIDKTDWTRIEKIK